MKNIKMIVKKMVQVVCVLGVAMMVNGSDVQAIDNKELITDGVTISAENWIEDDMSENSDLDGNVVIEDDGMIIEISKEVYDSIEHGENSDIEGDIYLDNDDIISIRTINQVDSDDRYTKDDYCEYLQYKKSLIDEHGKVIYDLMNQEACITSEYSSFKHYMKYGI